MGEGTPVLLDHGREQEKNVFQKAGMEKVLAPWRGKGRFSSATRVFAARKLLREEKIDAVICMGAFPCIAPGLAAATLRKPLFLLEQNRVMGKANRILALFASKIFLSMPLLKSSRSIRARSAILGCPVRDEFQPTGLPEEPLRLVVMGGSQGAREVNQKVLEIANKIPSNLKIKEEKGKRYGKWILRKTFEKHIPAQIAWRRKSPMQDGAGTVGLTNLFESIINEEKYVEKKLTVEKEDQVVIRSRESMYYYEIFKKLYGSPVKNDAEVKCPYCKHEINNSKFCRMCGAFPI